MKMKHYRGRGPSWGEIFASAFAIGFKKGKGLGQLEKWVSLGEEVNKSEVSQNISKYNMVLGPFRFTWSNV